MKMRNMFLLIVAVLMLTCAVMLTADDSEAVTTDSGEIRLTTGDTLIGTYTYNNGALTLTRNTGFENNTSQAHFVSSGTVFSPGDVTSVLVNEYKTDVTNWIIDGSYTSLNGNITYMGVFETNGTWYYYHSSKSLQISTGTPSSVIPNYSTNSGFFKDHFFKSVSDVEVTISNYASGGEYLFYGFDLKSFTSSSYTAVNNNKILDNSNVREITLSSTSLTSVASGGIFCNSLKQYLESVTLPSVTQIGGSTFSGFTALLSITADNVAQVGGSAFSGCESLETVSMAALNNVGSSAFSGCVSLEEIEFASNTIVGNNAFNGCTALTTISSENITILQYSAFKDCSSLYRSFINSDKLVFTSLETVSSSTGSTPSSDYSPFRGCTSLSEVQLPAVSSLDAYTFYGLSSLQTVVIGDIITTIGNNMFQNCIGLSSVSLGTSVVSIGASAFEGCTALSSIVFPDSLRTIGEKAFKSSGLASLDTKNVTQIDTDAFRACTLLETVVFGSPLMSIGDTAFGESTNIRGTVTFGANLETIGTGAFSNSKIVTLVFASGPGSGSTVSIGASAFSGCTSLRSISMGNRVGSIGDSAFSGCTGIDTDLTLSVKTTTIGPNAFKGCTQMTGLIIPADSILVSVGKEAFYNCMNMTGSLDFPSTITLIDEGAFNCASQAQKVKITGLNFAPSTASSLTIGKQAFRYCNLIVGTVTFPASLSSIEESAFSNCSGIQEIVFTAGTIPVTIGPSSFTNCTGIDQPIVFPAKLTTLGNGAFNICSSIPSISFAAGCELTRIGDSAFRLCEAIQSVGDLPSGVTYIGSQAFYGNGIVGSLVLPDSLVTLAGSAFYNCSEITSVTFGNSLVTIGTQAFYNCKKLSCDLVFPDTLETIGTSAFTGTAGNIPSITGITFGSALTSIGTSAFQGAILPVADVASVDLVFPASLIIINTSAFNGCTGISTIAFENGSVLTTIGDTAFYNCTNLGSDVDIPSSVTTIGSSAFFNSHITSICGNGADLSGTHITEIKSSAFSGCTYLSGELSLPTTLVYIRSNAFSNCAELTGIDFNGNTVLQSIEGSAFQNCSKITGIIEFPESLTNIGGSTFSGCSEILGIDFGANGHLTSIGSNAFINCSKLTGTVTFPDTLQYINNASFDNTAVVSFVIGKNVGTIGSRALMSTALESITVDVDNTTYFASDDILYDKSVSTLWLCPAKRASNTLVIPDTVTRIASYAFYRTITLSTVTLPSSTLTIEDRAFEESSITGRLVIPEDTVSIGQYAFRSTSITELVIESTRPNLLSAFAFQNCTSLTELTVPISVKLVYQTGTNSSNTVFGTGTSIRTYTFTGSESGLGDFYTKFYAQMPWYFTSSATGVNISIVFDGVGVIDPYMFYSGNSYKYIKSVDLGVATVIGQNAFYAQSGITSLRVSDGLSTVGQNAFQGCTSIETLSIPVDVDATKISITQGVTGLTSLTLREGDSGVGINYTSTQVSSLVWSGSSGYAVIIEDGVTSLGTNMFLSASGTLSVPGTVETISAHAFDGSTITTLTLGDGVRVLGERAFANCVSLSTLTLPNSLTNISAGYQFEGCTNLRNVYLPITLIYNETMFSGCTGMQNFHFTMGNTGIGPDYTAVTVQNTPWYGVCGTTNFSVTFGSGITKIGQYMFYGCVRDLGEGRGATGLSGTVVIPNSVTTIGQYAFSECTKITGVSISGSNVEIGSGAFKGCTGLNALTFPLTSDSVVDVDAPIFEGCTAITTVNFTGTGAGYVYDANTCQKTPWYYSNRNMTITIGSGITSIGAYTFNGCSRISGTVTLGTAIDNIGTNAFKGCTGITGLEIMSNTAVLGAGAFSGCTGINTLTVDIAVDTVVSETNPAFEGCTGLNSLVLLGGGTGLNAKNYTETTSALTPWKQSLTSYSLTIDSGVRKIGEYMFYNNTRLSGDISASNLENLSQYSFTGCTGLASFSAPNLTVMGAHAFEGCTSLASVSMDSLEQVPDYAFTNCSSLSTAALDSCVRVGERAFQSSGIRYVNSASEVSLPKLTHIGDYAFAGAAMTAITLGNESTSFVQFGDHVLLECPNLVTVNINGILSRLPNETFRAASTPGSFVFRIRYVNANKVAIYAASMENMAYLETFSATSVTNFEPNSAASEGKFRGCTSLTTVTLSTNNLVLPKYAFYGCTSLTTINTANLNLEKGYEFYGCTFLETVTLTSATTIPEYTFYGCTALTTVIASSVVQIKERAFAGSGIATVGSGNVIIPNLNSVGIGAFENCGSLVSVTSSMTTAAESAFSGCGMLSVVSLPELTSIPASMFSGCSALGTLSIPKAVSVAEKAFYNCSNLETVSLPQVTRVGNITYTADNLGDYTIYSVFYGCNRLSAVTMPSAASVGAFAFYNCGSLTSFNGDGVLNLTTVSYVGFAAFAYTTPTAVSVGTGSTSDIKDYAFWGCNAMTSFTVNGGLSSLGRHALDGCSLISSLTIPISADWTMEYRLSNLNSITFTVGSSSAGYDYTEATAASTLWSASSNYSVSFGSGITRIGDWMRLSASGSVSIPSTVTSIGTKAFYEAPMTSLTIANGTSLTLGDEAFGACTSLSSLTLPDSLSSFTGSPFNGCTSLTSVTLPISFGYTGSMFNGCTSLSSFAFTRGTGNGYVYSEQTYQLTPWYTESSSVTVTFADGINSIGAYTFKGCTKLAGAVSLPSSLTSVGAYAFEGDSNITSLSFAANNVTLSNGSFGGCSGIKTLIIPIRVNAVVNPEDAAFEGCNGLTSLTLSGNGDGVAYEESENSNYYYAKTPWYQSRNNASLTVTISDGITSIGNNMFRGCTALSGDITANGVTSIGSHVFDGCTKVTAFTAPNLLSMGTYAFNGCTALTAVSTSASISSVPDYAFNGCTSLVSASTYNVTSIGRYAFAYSGIKNIKETGTGVDLSGVSSIGEYAFARSNVEVITIGTLGSDFTMGDGVLLECPYLTTVTINGNLNTLMMNTFISSETTGFTSKLSVLTANHVGTFEAMMTNFRNLTEVHLTGTTSFTAAETEGMFKNCVSLSVVELYDEDDSLAIDLPKSAFEGCIALSSLNMTHMTVNYGREFFGCTSLNNLTLSQATKISSYTFYGCTSLTNVNAPKVTSIESYAFHGSGLTSITSAMFPMLLTIGDYAFANCLSLASVELSEVTNMGTYVFSGCTTLTDATFVRLGEVNTGTFYGNNRLRNVTLTNATSIRELAFYGCRALASISLPKVATIGDTSASTYPLTDYVEKSVFYNCVTLARVEAPLITHVGAFAFYNCSNLVAFNVDPLETGMNLPDIVAIRFAAFAGTGFVNVTVGKVGGMSAISDYAFYGCSNLKNFSAPSLLETPTHLFNTEDIGASSLVPLLENLSLPRVVSFQSNLHDCRYLTTVQLPSAVSFCNDAFRGCSQLTTVSLPASQFTLSLRMFYGCERLTTVENLEYAVFSGGYTNGSNGETFYGCRLLTTVNLPLAVFIPSSAFYGCTGLQTVTALNAVNIGSESFRGCTSLTTANIPSATKIYNNAFYGCTSLSTINPNEDIPFLNIVQIYQGAFYECALTELVLGPNLTDLGVDAFAYNRITKVVIPNSTNSNFVIPERVFYNCPLATVHISSSVKNIYSNAFDVSGTSTNTIEFWFNGDFDLSFLRSAAIKGTSAQTLIVHADSSSIQIIDTMVSSGYITGFGSISKRAEAYATVNIGTEVNANPTYTNIRAIYGGLIVLPFVNYGNSVLGAVQYAVVDSDSRHLAMFASDDDHAVGTIASTGFAVPIYPAKNADGIDITSRVDGSGYDEDITVLTQSYGTIVDIDSQTVWYGKTMVIPHFTDTSIQVKGLNLIRADGATYPMETTLVSINVSYYFATIEMLSEDVTVEVVFISKGVVVPVEVQIQSTFAVPQELRYMEIPDPGYSFNGWYSSEGGAGNKAGPDTKFSQGQRWFAYFVAIEYTIEIGSDNPDYYAQFTAVGPYAFHVINSSLYYTDTVNTANVLIFDANSIVGYSVNVYSDRATDTGITGDYNLYMTDPDNSYVDLYLTMKKYTLNLRFEDNNGTALADTFRIEGWVVGTGTEYKTGDTITDIPYSQIENGLAMPIPLNNDYAFVRMLAGSTQIAYRNGYFLTVNHFDGQTADITYVVQQGLYTIKFTLNDDTGRVNTGSGSVSVGESFTMPYVQRNYSKSGYIFDHIEITGVGGNYSEGESVVLTQEMADHATDCVVDVYVIWITIPYKVVFTLTPYTGTVPGIDDVRVGETVTLPEVSGYTGYKVTGWHWYLGEASSQSFTTDQVLTKEVVDAYSSTDRTLYIQAEWTKKTYVLSVDIETGYVFNTINVVYGETFTLWTNTHTRQFMSFGGWQIYDTVYNNSATVPLDDNMATYGDANGDKIVFGMYWIKSEYQVQYNLDEGKGVIPTDDKVYIVDETPFSLAVIDPDRTYREGYTFQGWKYSKTSPLIYTNTSGYFETVLASNADSNNIVTFYAVWEQKSYRITYELDQGMAGDFAPSRVFYGDEILISNPTRSGYDFAGWTASGLTDGALYKSSSGYRGWDGVKAVMTEYFMDLCNQDEGVVTMTAHWEQATYTITYDLNGGTGIATGTQKQISIGQVIVLPTLRNPAKTGFEQTGWGLDKLNALAPGTVFTEEMAPTTGNTLVLYVIWTPIEYQVIYRYTPDYDYTSLTVEYGDTVVIPIQNRSGYTFKGWRVSNADTNVAFYSYDGNDWYRLGTTPVEAQYFKNLTAAKNTTITFEAIWENNTYRLIYNANGGTGTAPVDSNVYSVGDKIEMKDYNVLAGTNGSKSVVGWSLEQNGSSTNVTEFTSSLSEYADATNAVNFYAVWVDGMCTVSVFLEGSSVSAPPAGWTLSINGSYDKLVPYGSSTKEVMTDWDNVTVSKNGYNFTGWSYSSATITSTVSVSPVFEKVNMSIMYVFGGVIGAVVVGAIVLVRLKI